MALIAKINSKEGNRRYFMFSTANNKTFTATAAVSGEIANAPKGWKVELEGAEFFPRKEKNEAGEWVDSASPTLTYTNCKLIKPSSINPFELAEEAPEEPIF